MFYAPTTTVESSFNSPARDAQAAGPFDCRERLSPKRQQAVSALVLGLLSPSGPTAVRRCVVSVHVDAVDRTISRRLAHVGKERLEGTSPSCADLDSSTAVVLEVVALRISAALEHFAPSTVRAGLRERTASQAPSVLSTRAFLRTRVAAPLGVSANVAKARPPHFHHVSTVAAASPVGQGCAVNFAHAILSTPKHGERANAATSHVDEQVFAASCRIDGFRERAAYRPTALKPHSHGEVGHLEFVTPCSHRLCPAPEGHHA